MSPKPKLKPKQPPQPASPKLLTNLLHILFYLGFILLLFIKPHYFYIYALGFLILFLIDFAYFSKSIQLKLVFCLLIAIGLYLLLGPVLLFQSEPVVWDHAAAVQGNYGFTVNLHQPFNYPVYIEKTSLLRNDFKVLPTSLPNQVALAIRQLQPREYQPGRVWIFYRAYGLPLITNLGY